MKCSLNPSTTVNAKSGKKSKTCRINKAWNEMNNERLGRDQTIDKTMTDKNVWMVGDTNDNVVGIAEKEIDRVNKERADVGLKAIRKDSVTVLSIVEKPPMDYMKNLSYEDRIQFLKDSNTVMEDLLRKWNPHWRTIEAVQHHDEFGGLSAHTHRLVIIPTIEKIELKEDLVIKGVIKHRKGDVIDKHLFNAKKEANLKFFNFINKNYPSMMRKLGYDVADCRTYDQLTEEEKIERKANPVEHGIDAVEYKKAHIGDLAEEYKHLLSENQELKVELSKKETIIQELRDKIETYKEVVTDLKEKITRIANKIGSRIMSVLGIDLPEGIPEMPSLEVSSEIKSMTDETKQIDPRLCYVVKNSKEGTYDVVYRTKAGAHEILRGGFATRALADQFRKSIKNASGGDGESEGDSQKMKW